MPHLQAQSFGLHIEGTLSSVFSAAPPCNTTGKLFIEAGFKGGERASFIEVILLLYEAERTAWCLLYAAWQTAFTFPNLYRLGKEYYRKLRSEMSLPQRQQWLFKATVHPGGGLSFDFGQFSSDEETPKCAVITRRLSLALLTVSGRPNLRTPVSAEGEFSGLWAGFVLHSCQPDCKISLGCKSSKNKRALLKNRRRCPEQVFQLSWSTLSIQERVSHL